MGNALSQLWSFCFKIFSAGTLLAIALENLAKVAETLSKTYHQEVLADQAKQEKSNKKAVDSA